MADIEKRIKSMTDEELVGVILSWRVKSDITEEEWVEFVKKNKATSFLANGVPLEKREMMMRVIRENLNEPCFITADVEGGPVFTKECSKNVPFMMTYGATDDEDLIYEIGKYTARLVRAKGVRLAFGPVIDINYNFLNPLVNTRAASDDPDKVIKIAGAYGRGLRSEGRVCTTLKHFPGDGVDGRNQHFLTSVNSLSEKEWWDGFGRVYKSAIDEGAEAIMVAHIALPFFDGEKDEVGEYRPATLSKRLMTDFIRGELGFDGCIVSDAMSMVGTAAKCPNDKLSVEFLRAGGDLVLFPEKNDHERILDALRSGYLPRERFLDAVRHVMKLKDKLGLYESDVDAPAAEEDIAYMNELLLKAARKSITLVRNVDNILPLNNKKSGKLLVITLDPAQRDVTSDPLAQFGKDLEERGFEVIKMTNPEHYEIDKIVDEMDAVFIISNINVSNCSGSSMRIGWNNIMTFWRGYVLRNKNLVFISFGDPYKLYDLPFIKTYVNAYHPNNYAIKAAIEACFGEIDFMGKSPVDVNSPIIF